VRPSGVIKTVCCLLASSLAAQTPEIRLDQSRLCVTEGAIKTDRGRRLSVKASRLRAVASIPTAHAVEIRFTYHGASAQRSSLSSGQIREQLGLKLRAADGCNVVYAMWRIAPRNELVVSVKHNPALHQSVECGNRGYMNIKPRQAGAIPVLRPGQAHSLRAEIHGQEMQVFIDGRKCWAGNLGPESVAFDGPVGMRTDNVDLDFELFAAAPEPGTRMALPACADS